MDMAAFSLIALVLVIAIGYFTKVNIGVIALAAAFLIGIPNGMAYKEIVGGFPTSLFITLLGVQVLGVIAKECGALDVFCKKIIKLCSGKTYYFIPLILFVAAAFGEAVGTNLVAVIALLMVGLTFQLGVPVYKLGLMVAFGMMACNFSPFAAPGITLASSAADVGIQFNSWNLVLLNTIVTTILFLIFYFVSGWAKEKPKTIVIQADEVRFNQKQRIVMIGFGCFIAGNLVFHLDAGVSAFVVSAVLLILRISDQQKVLKGIPWSTLILIGGMSVMVGVCKNLGGVTLLAKGITLVANKTVAPLLVSVIASLMSVVSSAMGVVIPTLVPTVPDIAASFPGLSQQALVFAIGTGAYAAAVSPMSTIGGYLMAGYGTIYNPTEEEKTKFFLQLLMFAGISMIFYAAVAALGWYNLTLIH